MIICALAHKFKYKNLNYSGFFKKFKTLNRKAVVYYNIAHMSQKAHTGETFFTSVGCMDGRVQKAVNRYASLLFGAEYADTVTRAGLDGIFSKEDVDPQVHEAIKDMILVSVDKHKSYGIIVHGHEECAGNPVSDEQHKKDINKSVQTIEKMVAGKNIKVRGVYVRLNPRLKIEEVV